MVYGINKKKTNFSMDFGTLKCFIISHKRREDVLRFKTANFLPAKPK